MYDIKNECVLIIRKEHSIKTKSGFYFHSFNTAKLKYKVADGLFKNVNWTFINILNGEDDFIFLVSGLFKNAFSLALAS